MAKRIVGISPWSPHDNPDYELMKEAGIEWIREGIYFPYGADKDIVLESYEKTLARMKKAQSHGMKIACVSPIPAGYSYNKKLDKVADHRNAPEWMGAFDSDEFYENTYDILKKIGEDTKGLVDLWQVSNEMDIREFRGVMTVEQAGRYLLSSAKGLRDGNPDALLGINPAGYKSDDGVYLYELCYKQNPDLLDYIGVDGYFGTWQSGGVQDWIIVIDHLFESLGKPVLVNEWGYNSSGGEAGEGYVCDTGHFNHVWLKEHSPEEQAQYVAAGIRLLLTYPNCLGFLYYSWGDDGSCWHCGKVGCPGESTWGITDGNNNPKPAYYAFKENVLKYNA